MSTLTSETRALTSPFEDHHEPAPPPIERGRFRHTLRGFRRGVRGQSNFFVYFFCAALAVAGAVALDATLVDWCLLALCFAGSLTAEMFRSAIAAVASPWVDQDPRCAEGLEIASGAVLIAVCTSAGIASVVFIHRIGDLFGWWNGAA